MTGALHINDSEVVATGTAVLVPGDTLKILVADGQESVTIEFVFTERGLVDLLGSLVSDRFKPGLRSEFVSQTHVRLTLYGSIKEISWAQRVPIGSLSDRPLSMLIAVQEVGTVRVFAYTFTLQGGQNG
jgi:hypothetical protein